MTAPMSEPTVSEERVEALASDIWHDFEGSPFIDITPRDAESIARSILASPAMRDLLAEVWDEGFDEGSDDVFGRRDSNPCRTEQR